MPVPDRPTRHPRRLLRDLTFESLLTAILDGTLQPGERLFEDDIAAWLGVSKTPVKEALARLATHGLVDIEANRYTRVASVTTTDLLDTFELIGVLHADAIRSAGSAPVDETTPIVERLVATLDSEDATCADLIRESAAFLTRAENPLTCKAAEPLDHRAAFHSRHVSVGLHSPALRPAVERLRSALADRRWTEAGEATAALLGRVSLGPALAEVADIPTTPDARRGAR
ncbi:GntR family transcriptional regulator [Frigoribacterium faeni]|uniref:Transcriptional regulator, GntR family protein n=1 Tax=Frigoribacterium faeni TaxID=145483 RepID=A0ABQ0UNH3_9MICO|nr:GntR family transcriptional regulator [Frigoribacterium faeni]BFF15700.1 GntR family transcriptional regulator [Microbacterium flavescens]GEK83034.1 putative transcriptional regulator, GntR family protein [Frigoribacterium faeni]